MSEIRNHSKMKARKTKGFKMDMDNNSLSTNAASEKLRIDLGLNYGLGRAVVAHFFNLVQATSTANYWEPKVKYETLVSENESIDFVKDRIKSKIDKFWFKGSDQKNGILILLPEKDQRKTLYMKAFKLKIERGGSKIPNQVLLDFLINEVGHYNKDYKGSHH